MSEVFDFGLQQHKIKMDGKFFESNLFAVAGDTGRRLEVQLLDSNNMVQNTTGISLRLNANVAGQATYAEATLVDATKGLYELDLPNGMLIAPGNWQFQWQIIGTSGEKLHSFAFTGSVGSNLSEGGSEATNFYLNVDDLKQMQDDLVNGTFNSEVLETNIAEKLTDLETQYAPKLNEVTAQLAQTVKHDENESITTTMLSPEIKKSLNDGEWNFNMNTSDIENGAVTEKKVSFMERETHNLLDTSKLSVNSAINTDGTLKVQIGWMVSDFIEVEPGKTYTTYESSYKACYDVNEILVGSVIDAQKITVPTSAKFIRVNIRQTYIATDMVVEGSIFPTTYIPYSPYYNLSERIKVKLKEGSVEGNHLKNKTITESKVSFLSGYINLLNPVTTSVDLVIDRYTGGLKSQTGGWSTSDFIEALPNATYVTSEKAYKAAYDENKTLIASSFIDSASIKTPVNAKYIRVTIRTSKVGVSEMVVEAEIYPVNYLAYGESPRYSFGDNIEIPKNIWQGKIWNALGDSVSTEGLYTTKAYYSNASLLLGGMKVNNYGVSGTEISTGGTSANPFISRYTTMSIDADLITVFGGVNDYLHGIELGTFDSRDNSTFYGALHNLCIGLYTKFPNAVYGFITPLQTYGFQGGDGRLSNTKGYKLEAYVIAIKEVCAYYSIPVLDLYNKAGITPYVPTAKTTYYVDGLHPNDAGHSVIGQKIAAFIKTL